MNVNIAYAIYTQGGGEILVGTLNAVAALVNSNSGSLFAPLMRIGGFVGCLAALMGALWRTNPLNQLPYVKAQESSQGFGEAFSVKPLSQSVGSNEVITRENVQVGLRTMQSEGSQRGERAKGENLGEEHHEVFRGNVVLFLDPSNVGLDKPCVYACARECPLKQRAQDDHICEGRHEDKGHQSSKWIFPMVDRYNGGQNAQNAAPIDCAKQSFERVTRNVVFDSHIEHLLQLHQYSKTSLPSPFLFISF